MLLSVALGSPPDDPVRGLGPCSSPPRMLRSGASLCRILSVASDAPVRGTGFTPGRSSPGASAELHSAPGGDGSSVPNPTASVWSIAENKLAEDHRTLPLSPPCAHRNQRSRHSPCGLWSASALRCVLLLEGEVHVHMNWHAHFNPLPSHSCPSDANERNWGFRCL